MNLFITGVSGFAGTNLAQYFNNQRGIKIYGHSRNPQIAQKRLQEYGVEFVATYNAKLFDQLQIDCIIHLAGVAHDLSNQYVAEDYFEVNDKQTRKIYQDFLTCGATKFIYLSSIKAAVDIAHTPADELVAPAPVSHYGKSKLQAELFIQQQPVPSGKRFFIFRPCMIHGPGNKGNLNLLYKFVRSRIPYPLSSFKNKRSFLGVDNFNFVIHEFVTRDLPSGIYHLADDGYLSTTDLYRLIASTSGITPRIIPVPAAFVKTAFKIIGRSMMLDKLTEDMMVSNQKLVQTLGKPLPVGMTEGIVKTIHSFH